jgi:hypothetical protein
MEQTGRRGLVRLSMDGVPPGKQRLRIRALDLLGNATELEYEIELYEGNPGELSDVYNIPNPFAQSTKFYFKMSGDATLVGGQPSKFAIRIYDQAGRAVRILKNVEPGVTEWNGRDDRGNLLANGLYFYRVFSQTQIPDPNTGLPQEKFHSRLQKLVISR